MYGRYNANVSRNESEKSNYIRHIMQTRDLENLENRKRRLEREIEDLRVKKKNLYKCLPERESSRVFKSWGGFEIQDSTEEYFNIKFLPSNKGKIFGTFSVSFKKLGPFWSLGHQDLPYSIQDLCQRVQDAKIDTIEKLSTFVGRLQHEVNLYFWRREQFNEAKKLRSDSVRIHPSVNTRTVLLTFNVDDNGGSNLCKAAVHLTYGSHSYLPLSIAYNFLGGGGDEEAQRDFKNQLAPLEFMPLKDAIRSAFFIESTESALSAPKMKQTSSSRPVEKKTQGKHPRITFSPKSS